MQMMMRFAEGVEAFGMIPARPLKSLLIQGENDEADMVEMRDSVARSLQLTEMQKATINQNVLVCTEHDLVGDEFFNKVVEPLLQVHRPDLLWIDPLLQHLDGDANQQQVVGGFLRGKLAPLVKRHNCAVVLVHHTGKPQKNTKRNNNPMLSAYDAAGSAEFSNWPRAVLSLQTDKQPGHYRLVAGKRGNRLDWKMPDGCTRAYEKHLQHSTEPGTIFWSEVVDIAARVGGEATNPAGDNPNGSRCAGDGRDAHNQVLARVPAGGIEKKELVLITNKQTGIATNRLGKLIAELMTENKLQPFNVPRQGKRAAIHLRRVDDDVAPAADVSDPKTVS